MTGSNKALKSLREAQAALKRMETRREEIATRPVADEARRLRFLRRMDRDIEAARNRVIVAEAEYEMARAQALAEAYKRRGESE